MMYGQILQALLDVVQYAQPRGDGSSYNGPSLAKEKDGNAGCKYYGEVTTAHHISLCSLGSDQYGAAPL